MTSAVNACRLHVSHDLRPNQQKKLIDASAKSIARVAKERAETAEAVKSTESVRATRRALKPASMASGMRKAGIALIATPDPITGVPGVALLASSFVAKRKEPAGLDHLAKEARKLLRDLQSLRL